MPSGLRKLPSMLLVVLFALATAGVAAASNGGFTPVTPESPNASHTQTAYYVILGFTSAIFLLVEGLLVAFIWKYRSRGRSRSVEGAQVHGHTRLELIWTVIPVVILCVIGVVVFVELPKINDAPAATNAIPITVVGHQYYWEYEYPNGSRSIGTLHVPVDRVVDLRVTSPDVIHSWWIPALGGKIQAIPGRTNHFWFKAEKPGSYEGQCAELCGVFHAEMLATVDVGSEASYRNYVSTAAKQTIGQQEWGGVCATCHGDRGTGGYGPAIANNSLITQESALAGIVRNGYTGTQGAMPPVGKGWTDGQISALVAYVKKHIYSQASLGGSSGG
jgi:cytochrome c oxidase subunit 2